ncbi:MAG: inositol monophosphatase family protein [Planctomycetota bacterium]|jgi:myo-inositol-1(or 4)-monophosphatase
MALEHTDISRMLEVAVVAARLGGQRAVEEMRYIKSSIKNGCEIVTQADRTCQDLIISRIKETYPDHGFIAEEGADGKMFKQPPRGSESVWWVIDPIDGTNNYAHGLLCFSVAIAAICEGEPVAAAIFVPATESMFTAAKGTDAQLNNSRITVSDEAANQFSCFGLDSHFKPEHEPAIYEIMRRTKFRSLGSASLQFAYVARGALIGSVAMFAKLWDIAAGALLIARAGGIMTDLAGNNVFPMEPADYAGQPYQILSANEKNHAALLDIFKTGQAQ